MTEYDNKMQLANTLRVLAMDAVEAAKSGHPGMPMGMADIAEVLWRGNLKHSPLNPSWTNRDRFVLSNGHGSMLLYGLLHLTGYDVSIEEIKNFRKLGSKTPGHPEYGITPGVETTTGPLGQGIANAVGMAISEKMLSERFNKESFDIVDHMTYAFTGDGCLMEGISHEACSLAGTLGLSKLIVIYDDNGISIDGPVEGWFTEDIPARFESYGWQAIADVDGHDPDQISAAINLAKAENSKPTIICCKTIIGKGSPNKAGTSSTHGSAFGEEELQNIREELGWTHKPFEIPKEIYEAWNFQQKGEKLESDWNALFSEYTSCFPELAKEYERCMSMDQPSGLDSALMKFAANMQEEKLTIATRKSSEMVINVLGPLMPELVGGSADLTGSNNTNWSGTVAITKDNFSGNYLNYGVREFAMTGIMNGMVLHGGTRPYSGTFLTFLDYARNAVRMSALMKIPTVLVYSHDSIGVGEDGPTHQPIEHLTSLRTTPNLETWRPCDTVETVFAWKAAIHNKTKPTALILSRQNLPTIDRDASQVSLIDKGGYVVYESSDAPKLVLMSTGSELSATLEAAKEIQDRISVRVVSIPCTERFDAQGKDYIESVLGKNSNRVAVEASHEDWWRKYVGLNGRVIGMDSFGESAPGDVLADHFGFTKVKIVAALQEYL
jgi:transketolase